MRVCYALFGIFWVRYYRGLQLFVVDVLPVDRFKEGVLLDVFGAILASEAPRRKLTCKLEYDVT